MSKLLLVEDDETIVENLCVFYNRKVFLLSQYLDRSILLNY